MIKRYLFAVLTVLLLMMVFSTAVLAAPNVVVTNSGLALLIGETDVRPGSSVIVQVVPKGEGSITADGRINGYVNETVIQPDGSYKLLFSLDGLYETGSEYECHIDLAGKEYFLIPLKEGSLIEVSIKNYDRDTKEITISGSLWDSSAYGTELTLTMGDFEKTVQSSDEGKFEFRFTMAEAGVTEFGICDFVIAYADDASSYCEDSIDLPDVDGVLKKIKENSKSSDGLEEILAHEVNLQILGFDSMVIYGDFELSELAGSDFFKKLAKTDIKTDKVSSLAESIKTAYALYGMEENPSDKNLKRCLELFELDEENEFTTIYESFNDDAEPEYLFGLWKETSFVKLEEAEAFYKDAVLITKLNTAEAWSDLMLFSNENYGLLGVKKQTSAEFWQSLIRKSPFDSISDFEDKFEDVLEDKDKKPSSGGGSGGGGGGFGLSGTSAKTVPEQPVVNESKSIFGDVAKNHWASEAVEKLYELGIISGKADGIFAPNDLVTRAEVAKLMCTSAEINEINVINSNFGDVDKNHWAMGYIEAAFANGLVNGKGNGNFGPAECTTREDMAVFCYRLLKKIKPEYNDAEYTKSDLTFADSDEIAEYAIEAVAAMSKLGVINGKGDNKFDPKSYCTRAEAAKIFFGVLQ